MAEDVQQVQAVRETLYDTEAFDIEGVRSKQLCAVTDSSGNVIGTGIPQQNNSNFAVTVDGEKYIFDNHGNPVSSNAVSQSLTLKMATSNLPKIAKGTVGVTKNAYVRSINDETGAVEYNPDTTLDASYEITIEGLNARDQFALQALHGMFRVMDDPSAVSKNEITHYCEAAYLWASYMMTESSKARAVIKDAETTESTQAAEVGFLESNVEKLLNNIVAALDKTDEKDGNTYYERVSLKGWSDLMTKLTDIKNAITAQTTAIESIATAIGNLELSPTINNNIIVPENNGGE